MTLDEAHTENVKRAWDHLVKYGQDRTRQTMGHKAIHRIEQLTLSEALDLLTWVAERADVIYDVDKTNSPLSYWEWVVAWGEKHPHTENKIDNGSKHTFHDAVLLAIDAIVEEYPEVLE